MSVPEISIAQERVCEAMMANPTNGNRGDVEVMKALSDHLTLKEKSDGK